MSKIILLPGMDGTGELFGGLLEVIPPDVETRVISYPTDRVLSYAELLDLLMEQLSGEREMVLVAESFSGPLALRIATVWPARVRAVVLCASFVRFPRQRWLGWLARPILFRLPIPAFAVRRLMVGIDAHEALVRDVLRAVRRVRPGVLARRLKDLINVDASDALTKCRAPILHIAGRRDALVPASAVALIREIRKDVRISVVDGPHLILQVKPAECWREIEAFLREEGIAG
jgi:pimeloyl-ACP methyl ester carboxylesterase